MARRNAGMGVCVGGMLLLVVMMIGRPAAAQAPAPSVDCATAVFTLTDCFDFVTSNTTSSPAAACCTELASIVKSSPQCLCLLFNTSFVEPLGVNITRALELPAKCKVQTPPTSLCASVGIPVPGPVSPGLAPSPAAKSPATSPIAPGSAPTPITASSPSPAVAAPSGSTPLTGSPTATQPNVSSIAPSPPNSAHSISSRSAAGAAASLLLLASIFLS